MKKISLIFIAFLLSMNISLPLQEVFLEEPAPDYIISLAEEGENIPAKEKTLREKLSDVYHLEVLETNKPTFLLQDILTKHYSDESIWDRTQIWAAYNANLGFNFAEGEKFGSNYSFDYINLGLDGHLKDNNGDFRIMLNVSPLSNRNIP